MGWPRRPRCWWWWWSWCHTRQINRFDLVFDFGRRCGFGPVSWLDFALHFCLMCAKNANFRASPAPQCLCLVLQRLVSWVRCAVCLGPANKNCVCVKNCPSRQAQQAITAAVHWQEQEQSKPFAKLIKSSLDASAADSCLLHWCSWTWTAIWI